MPHFPKTAQTAQTLKAQVYSAANKAGSRPAPPKDAIALNVGDTYRAPPAAARTALEEIIQAPDAFRYGPPQGEPELIAAIVDKYGGALDAGRLQICAGATNGLAVITATLLDPGDHVLLLSPYWPLIRGIIRSRGAQLTEVPCFHHLGADNDGDFDLHTALENALQPNTTAIYVNSPNNPTGTVLSDAHLNTIADIADKHGLWVIADEAYEDFHFSQSPEELTNIWRHPKLAERTVAAHTLSKSYALAGARVGFLHGPKDFMPALMGAHTYLNYGAAKCMQRMAAVAVAEGDSWVKEAREAYALAAKLTAKTLGLATPKSGTFVFFDAKDDLAPGEDLAAFLSRCANNGLLLAPGSSCGQGFETWIRLCFTAVDEKTLAKGLEILVAEKARSHA